MPRPLPPASSPDWELEEDDLEEEGATRTWGPAETIELTLETDAGVERIGDLLT